MGAAWLAALGLATRADTMTGEITGEITGADIGTIGETAGLTTLTVAVLAGARGTAAIWAGTRRRARQAATTRPYTTRYSAKLAITPCISTSGVLA